MFIWTCKSVFDQCRWITVYSTRIWHLRMRVCIEARLHAILPGDGVAVLRVVQERHVDSNQRRPVSREDLTPDD